MKFQITEVILWPRDARFQPRTVRFAPGVVNVISGASKTGKSSVIPIIDYCLGSERCGVPVDTIRKACGWFGIQIQTDQGQKLLARKEPGVQQSTSEMYVLEGEKIQIPASIAQGNTTVDAVKKTLDRLAGLSNLGFDASDASFNGFKGRPSFRDMLAFTFQPQNIVANPDVLFFRADTMEHREKLRTIFPYVLGAVTPDTLAKKWELNQLTKDLQRLEREQQTRLQAAAVWKADLANWISEAKELGLIDIKAVPDQQTPEEAILLLEGIVTQSPAEARPSVDGFQGAAQEAVQLDKEEVEIALKLGDVRQRLNQIMQLRASIDEYSGALRKQRDRLGIARWLRTQGGADTKVSCPVCGGDFGGAKGELDSLCESLASVEASIGQLMQAPAAFDKELVNVRGEVGVLTESLRGVRTRKRALEDRSAAMKKAGLRSSAVERFVGRVQEALKLYRTPSDIEELRAKIEDLKARVSKLREEVADWTIKKRQEAALSRITGFMSQLLPQLDAERPNDPVQLDIQELTLKVGSQSGRSDFLWEIGSGANWLSYHLASTGALQRFFSDTVLNPVPGFVVYDQPSQVYFPRRPGRAVTEGEDPLFADEDVQATRKAFSMLGSLVGACAGKVQFIVLDHADQSVWGGLPGVSLVEEWRSGRHLVPLEWISN